MGKIYMISIEDLLDRLIEESCVYIRLLDNGCDSAQAASYIQYEKIKQIKQEILNYIDLLKE